MENSKENKNNKSKFGILRSSQTTDILYNFSNKYKETLDEMKELRYKASVLPVSRRVLSHWRDSSLLDPYNNNSDQINISFVALFWLMIAIELRVFGLSLEKISNIKRFLFSETKLPLFETYVFLSYIFKESDFFLIVSPVGNVDIGSKSEIEISESLGLVESNYIKINLATIRNRISPNKKGDIFKQSFKNNSLSKEEEDVLDVIRGGDYTEVVLKFKNNQVVSILAKSLTDYPNVMDEIRKSIRSSEDFCNISLVKRKGKFVVMEKVIMTKT